MSQKYSHPTPLTESYISTASLKQRPQKRKKSEEDNGENKYIDARESRKILKIRQELAEEEQLLSESKAASDPIFPERIDNNNTALDIPHSSSDAYEEDDEWEDDADDQSDGEDVNPVDLDVFDRYNSLPNNNILEENRPTSNKSAGCNLADLIVQKINDWEATHENGGAEDTNLKRDQKTDESEVPSKVIEVYSKVGLVLSRYKSGQLPKPVKVLPTMEGWETLISFTKPHLWTANACYEATKLFISGKSNIAQAFLNGIILDRVRDNIHETRKLNVHLYKALKKSLFKPAAFFKGFLFPLLESSTCTLREANIISSVLVRVSVPVLHSAAALNRLCDIAVQQMNLSTEAGGATNIFIRVLLDKKYALPYKVIDSLVFHFLRFRSSVLDRGINEEEDSDEGKFKKNEKLPVIWHQGLLAFAQRYKNDISEDQREALLDLITIKGHKAIGPEIRRELLEGRGGVPLRPTMPYNDDTMIMDIK